MSDFSFRTINRLDAGSEKPRRRLSVDLGLGKLPDAIVNHPPRMALLAEHEQRIHRELRELEQRSPGIAAENEMRERAIRSKAELYAKRPKCPQCGRQLRSKSMVQCAKCADKEVCHDRAGKHMGVAGGNAGVVSGEGE